MPLLPSKYAYPKITVKLSSGKKALTVAEAKKLLGWTVVEKGGLLKDRNGLFITCKNNTTNRPLSMSLILTYMQDILKKQWRLNGETIIIGREGNVLEGQHQMCALILAEQERENNPDRWKEYWTDSPTIEKVIVFGIAEDDDTVNTINTGKPRSLADVIFRSEYFAALPASDRKAVARSTSFAISMLWSRTGAGVGSFGSTRTHSESLDFLSHHPRLLECVKHIYEEDGKDNQIGKYLSTGYSAGFLYLMASGTTNPLEYRSADHADEQYLDWELWDSACDFFVLLAGNAKELKAVRMSLGNISNEDGSVNRKEQMALLAKSWNAYSNKTPITVKSLALKYSTDDDGIKSLIECPTVGGIDSVEDEPEIDVPTEEEIEERASTEKVNGMKEKKNGKPKVVGNVSTRIEVGAAVWVDEPNLDVWQGELVSSSLKTKTAIVKDELGDDYEVDIRAVQIDEPVAA
ncbi:hypothetical protein OAG36_00785 [bacterium]|nr:hypothetical protein [bacterium]